MLGNTARRSFDEIYSKAVEEKWEELPHRCPKCHNGAVEYHQEDEWGDSEEDFWYCLCSWCNASWWEPIEKE